MHKSQVIKTKGTKLEKKLEKSLKEAKEGKTNLLYDGKWHDGDMEFDDLEEMMENWRKKEKEKFKKMSPEERKTFKEKKKKKLDKMKAENKKNEEKWAKQRAKRGFSDADCWSMDYTLLKLIPDMLDHLAEYTIGWQPQLGYKIKNNKLVKLKKIKVKDKRTGRTYNKYPDITFEDQIKVLKYLSKGFRQLYAYLNMDDMDHKKDYTIAEYEARDKKIDALHEETFNLFKDIFYSLWW